MNLDKLDDEKIINEIQDNLSGGEIQKILIARAIYKESNLVIMDEPFSALDKKSKDRLASLIFDDKRSFVVIGHNLDVEIVEKFDKIIKVEKK